MKSDISPLDFIISIGSGPIVLAATLTILGVSYFVYRIRNTQRPYPDILLLGGDKGLTESKKSYIANSIDYVSAAVAESKSKIFQLYTDVGPKIVIPSRFIDEVKNEKNLSFSEFMKFDFMAEYPAFGAFHSATSDDIFQDAVRIKLTQSLALVTVGLSQETSLVLNELLPSSKEWRNSTPFHPLSIRLVSQLSARVFLGIPLCRDPRWLHISAAYTICIFRAAQALRAYPPFLRPIMYYLLKEIKEVKKLQSDAYKIIEPELKRRREIRREEEQMKTDPTIRREKPIDSLQWLDEVAASRNRSFDVILGQLAFTVAAIHTTGAALTNIMFDLTAHPELVTSLREEIISILGPNSEDGGGWKKTSLYKLRLMDSVIKESQRMNPTSVLTMKRMTVKEHKFSDGTVIPPGTPISMPISAFRDPAVFANPDTYDGYRFLKLREQPGNENKWQFVTTSAEMYGFGHGIHACPGRFFASNELKIALVHLLMKYEWDFVGLEKGIKGRPKTILRVDQIAPDPTAQLLYRNRISEIDFQ